MDAIPSWQVADARRRIAAGAERQRVRRHDARRVKRAKHPRDPEDDARWAEETAVTLAELRGRDAWGGDDYAVCGLSAAVLDDLPGLVADDPSDGPAWAGFVRAEDARCGSRRTSIPAYVAAYRERHGFEVCGLVRPPVALSRYLAACRVGRERSLARRMARAAARRGQG